MTLLEREPDNSAVDAWLRALEFNPADIPSFPVIDPNSLDPDLWPTFVQQGKGKLPFGLPGLEGTGWGVMGRPSKMTYFYGSPRALCPAVANPPHAQDPITRTLTGELTIGTSKTIETSVSIETNFFDMVKTTVQTSFGETWSKETKFSDSVTAQIRPGRMMWLELKPVICRIEGDFVWVKHIIWIKTAGRFSGTVESPGLEGGLHHVIALRDEPYTEAMHEQLQAVHGALPAGLLRGSANGDGLVEIPRELLLGQ